MTDSSGSSPSPLPHEQRAPVEAFADTAAYPAVWTRRILVAMAVLGVVVVVAAVLWTGGGGHHRGSATPAGRIGSAEAGGPAQGSPSTTALAGSAPSTSTTPGRPTTTVVGVPTTKPGKHAPTTVPSATITAPPTTVEATNFYDRGSVGPCPTSFGSAGSSSSSTAPLSQATAVATCLVHAWAWQLTTSKNGMVGLDALASPSLTPTLLNLGHFLNHLHLTPAGCTVAEVTGACTFTDGATDVVLELQQSAAYTYGWIASAVSWSAATKGGSTTTTTAAPTTTTTTAAPSPASAPAGASH